MSYMAEVAKHKHVQQEEEDADGETELPVVLCTHYALNPYLVGSVAVAGNTSCS